MLVGRISRQSQSPPSRGAWIEIAKIVKTSEDGKVAPPRRDRDAGQTVYRFILCGGLGLHGTLLKHQEQRRRSASSSLRMIFWRITSSGSSGGEFSISAALYLEAASQVTAGFLFTAVPQIA